MAKKNVFEVSLVANQLESAKEPFIGVVSSSGSVNDTDISNAIEKATPEIGNGKGLWVLEAIAAIVIASLEDAESVNLGKIRFEPAITGSVQFADSPLTTDNQIVVNIVNLGANALYDNAKVRVNGEEGNGDSVIDNVLDIATGAIGVVGVGTVVITGKNLFVGGEGEGVAIVDKDGTEVQMTNVTETGGNSGERIYCRIPAETEGLVDGVASLQVTTKGGGNTLHTVARGVKLELTA